VLLWELGRWSRQATVEGFQWDIPPFQNLYRRRAHEALNGVKVLASVAQEEANNDEESLSTLLLKICVFLRTYLTTKRRIPSDSYWHARIPQYADWYLSSEHAVHLATQTQTDIQPKMEPDSLWVEKELFGLLFSSVEEFARDGRTGVFLQLLSNLNTAFETLGTEWSVVYGERLLSDLAQTVNDFAAAIDQRRRAGSGGLTEAQARIGAIDAIALIPVSLLLGFISRAREINLEDLSDSIAQSDWKRSQASYDLGLPTHVLERLEFIQRCLHFEAQAEGRVTSPAWYLMQLVCQSIAISLHRQLDTLVSLGDNFYLPEADRWIEDRDPVLAATLLFRGLEFHHKLMAHLSAVQALTTSLDQTRRLHTLQWPVWNWELTEESVNESQDKLLACLARCIPGLAELGTIEDMPDYSGRAVHTMGQSCFQALVDNRPRLFLQAFPFFFRGALGICSRLQEKTDGWQRQAAVSASAAPAIDLCELSGYAKVFSEFHQEARFWQVCRNEWDQYFQGDHGEQRIRLVATIVAHDRSSYGLTPRVLLRTSWRQQLSRMLSAMSRLSRPVGDRLGVLSTIPYRTEIIDHPSLLIRLLGGTDSSHVFLMYDGLDVFVDLYLRRLSEARKLDLGRGHDLLGALERWRKAEEENNRIHISGSNLHSVASADDQGSELQQGDIKDEE
jgi:hypothetical protein